MSITVREFWQLKEFQSFSLVAGERGLDNPIENIGMLDYEFAMMYDENPRKWSFRKHDFVMTSFLFSKDKPELLLPAVKELCADQISALVVKNVCFTQLPPEVIAYADEHALPIFMFGREDAYFEDIVVTLKKQINDRNNLDYLEYRIALFMSGELEMKGQRELQKDILRDSVSKYRVLYCMAKDEGKDIRDYHTCYVLGEHVFYYRKGCFVVIYDPEPADTERTFQKCLLTLNEVLKASVDHYWIGISRVHDTVDSLRDAFQECHSAWMYAKLHDRKRVFFDRMGIYKALLPCYTNKWLHQFSNEMITKILEFDRKYEGSLYETLKEYVQFGGNVQEISNNLHLHKNTVRYRINKAKELLEMEEDRDFDLEIEIAFMLDELYQQFGEEH